MYKKILLKFIVIILIAGLNWLGFWAVIQAGAFFNDSETAQSSLFRTAFLDFSLDATEDFAPEIMPDVNLEREIKIVNNGNMDLHYDVGIDLVDGANDLCQVLDFELWRNNAFLSSSTLANFNLNNLYLATSSTDVFNFIVKLNSNDYGYWSKTCKFDLIFDGEQIDKKGFSDSEIISNMVTSGIWENVVDHLLINKVYYNVDVAHGADPKNEWIELYNPTDVEINIKNWKICDSGKCLKIGPMIKIPAKGYIMLGHDTNTWHFWELPVDVQTSNVLGGQFGMENDADMIILKDDNNDIVDQMNWGAPNSNWLNYNSGVWNPGLETVVQGHMLGRVPSGTDTDAKSDWKDLAMPEVTVLNPNGGEVWWVGHNEEIEWEAHNPNGADADLLIELYYSNNSGRTWGFIGTTINTGYYSFRLPLFLENFTYYVPSEKSRIKVVAIGPENFVLRASDISDEDYCPPIDYSLLTEEELAYLIAMGLYQNVGEEQASASAELLELSIDLIGTEEDIQDTQHAESNTQEDSEDVVEEESVIESEEENLQEPSSMDAQSEESVVESEAEEESDVVFEEENIQEPSSADALSEETDQTNQAMPVIEESTPLIPENDSVENTQEFNFTTPEISSGDNP